MSTTGHVLAGLRSPRALILTITPSTNVPSLDSATVTAASLRVWRGDDSIQTWTCAIVSQTAALLVLAHPWVAGDNDTPGETLRVYAQLTIGGVPVEVQAAVVTVTPR